MKIAVTGAMGFIGSHLDASLGEEGYDVIRIVEPGIDCKLPDVRSIPVDVTSGKGLREGLEGVSVIIHLAARNHILNDASTNPLADYRRVNVEGTRNVIRAGVACGAKFFVHFSSVKAMGEETEYVLDEDSPCMPMTPYGISKLESEDVVRSDADRTGMRAVIVRLPMVYGPRNKGNLPRMIRWADRGLPFPLFQPDSLRSIIYVENVVAGVLALLTHAPEGVSTYILKDREDCSPRRLFTAICRELGKPARFLPVPAAMVRLGTMISKDLLKITGSFRVSSAKIERDIGFTSPISTEEGVAKTVRWYKHSNR